MTAMIEIETKKDERIFETNNAKEMIGSYLAEDVKRKWTEDFVDESTSEIVTIDRFDIVAVRGTLITNEIASEIMFYIQSGDVEKVKCSSQSRKAILSTNTSMTVWSVSVQVEKKKHRFLLYAQGINQALEIVKDYVELNYEGRFIIRSAKEFNDCIILQDNMSKMVETENGTVVEDDKEKAIDKHFYFIECNTIEGDTGETSFRYTFLVYAKDVDAAKEIIDRTIDKKVKERAEKDGTEPLSVTTSIETASIVKCSQVIDRDFSEAYREDQSEL